jgi:cellulose synthase/poly-beta-1,6-N-acetylglucosamine synthase-like glycosyltransferase
MDPAEIIQTVFLSVYTFMLVMVSIYGLHRYVLVMLYYRHKNKAPQPMGTFDELPTVTIQLPMYNERLVARRIIEQTCKIDYPRERLQIQVLDDSTDETCDVAQATVAQAKANGFDIEYIHREDRTGYKAGALANGLETARGEFVTIFDADFMPDACFLKRSIQHFTDPKVCVVQTRWDHLNRNDSLLTRTQGILLDGHFAIEHVARNRSGRFMSFNGTAGTWRRAAIDDAGGWHHDTLTEDLDLSYRAQLKGWRFVFLPELTAPAELPPEMNAFKAQQFRWTKGGAQTALKLLPKVMLSRAPLKVKVEAFFHLTCFSVHLYMLALVLMLFPAMFIKQGSSADGSMWAGVFDISVFVLATLSASVFYVASQFELFRDWRTALKFLPMLMALGVGLCVSNSKAILEAIFGRKSEFVRTPKYGDSTDGQVDQPTKKRKFNWLPYAELVFGIYMSACAIVSMMDYKSAFKSTPFLVIFAFGFFYVSTMSFQAQRARRTVKMPKAVASEKVES